MVRGNWQKRVERTEARRQQAKQRKQHSQDQRQYKQWAMDCLNALDQQAAKQKNRQRQQLPHVLQVHVWTDTLGNNNNTDDDDDDDPPEEMLDWLFRSASAGAGAASGGGKTRSRSMDETAPAAAGGGGGRSSKKKKAHPRSRESQGVAAQADTSSNDPLQNLLLCRSHFFTGTCASATPTSSGGKSKKGGGTSSSSSNHACRYVHYCKPYETMQQIVLPPSRRTTSGGGSTPRTPVITTTTKALQQQSRADLAAAETAARLAAASADEAFHESEPGAMIMLYYFCMNLQAPVLEQEQPAKEDEKETAKQQQQQPQQQPTISEQITSVLHRKQLKLANVVYMTMGNVLLYDRHREGCLLSSDDDFVRALLMGGEGDNQVQQAGRGRKLSFGAADGAAAGGGTADMTVGVFHRLPGTVLEHMLTFLPDTAVAAACKVCKSWYQEIGQNSPNLWLHLLRRRQWPLPAGYEQQPQPQQEQDTEVGHDASEQRHLVRQAFLKHYSLVRDASALQSALRDALEAAAASSHKKPVVSTTTREMAYMDFWKQKHSPREPDHCVSVHVWAPNQILVAYREDCSLRLFESSVTMTAATAAASKSSNTTSNNSNSRRQLVCKELVVQRVDPYQNTKKRTCSLLDTGLDEECIGCLCQVDADALNLHTFILIVVNREDYLLGEDSGHGSHHRHTGAMESSHLKVIDIGEAVLNYILSMEEATQHTVELVHFLQNGGEIGQVVTYVTPTIAACGYGRFLLEVSISIPDDTNLADGLNHLGRMLILCSAGIDAIVWSRDCNTLDRYHPEGEPPLLPGDNNLPTMISPLRRQEATGPRASCTIAVSPRRFMEPITVLDIEPSGEVFQTEVIQCPAAAADDHLSRLGAGEWRVSNNDRLFATTLTHIVVVDHHVLMINNNNNNAGGGGGRRRTDARSHTVVSFLPRFGASAATAPPARHSTFVMPLGARPTQLVCVRDEHVILLCEKDPVAEVVVPAADGDDGAHDENAAAAATSEEAVWEVLAILLHVPSGSEIGRQVWLRDNLPYVHSYPHSAVILTRDSHETLGAGLAWRGIAMTGSDVRRAVSDWSQHVLVGLDQRHHQQLQRSAKKNKKKKKANKSAGKKDGFARGMSLRG